MKTKKIVTAVIMCWLTTFLCAQNEGHTIRVDDETYKGLNALSKSRLGKGEIYLFTTTHQDIGWLDQPEICVINRDTLWLTPFLERLEKEPDFRMDIEQTSILMEYLRRHPDKKDMINRYLKEGRICVGATYIQPYEEMYAGESLARQFYFGSRWLKKNFDGYATHSYFNVDVPGRTLQMPQIMRKAGIDNLVISRHERGLFHWEAPDGSKVRTYSPGHYIYFYNVLGLTDEAAIKELAKEAAPWYLRFNNRPNVKAVMPAMLNYEFIWDPKPVLNCVPFTSKWNKIGYMQTEDGKQKTKINLPKFRYATADDFFHALDASTINLPSIMGERPNVWLYIHGPSHEQAITASRKGDILLPAAEKIASFGALVEGNFTHYPQQRLSSAWLSKIYPDHGWGGKGGEITDLTFLRKFEHALSEAELLVNISASRLASYVQTDEAKGIPVIVTNTLSWKRSEPVKIPVQLNKGFAEDLSVIDRSGKPVPCQTSEVSRYEDGSIQSARLCFVPQNVPPLGYATFYLNPRKKEAGAPQIPFDNSFENDFYKIDFAAGGIRQIKDKALGTELLETSKFLGGEVFTLQSVGNGAGEFDKVQQPTCEGFDKTSHYAPQWTRKEQGAVYTSFFFESKIRNAVVEQTVTVYHQVKKIDFDITIRNWEGILYREYRMAMPVKAKNGEVAYEVPYGVLRVGKDEMPGVAGERYNTPNNKLHPRGIANWINVSGEKLGLTLSSSVAVVDYIDPSDTTLPYPVIQPILFASRRSCHGEGNEYLQYGDHQFHFSFTSHPEGWQNGYRFGTASNESLQAVFDPPVFRNAHLPESFSFFDMDDENIVVSAIKKCEDDDSFIIRLYNLSDKTLAVNLNPAFTPEKIVKVNLTEEELGKVENIILDKYAIETYKIIFRR
ncbi:MAG: glycosyl hydrolase-related protein [Prevotellaceae bacterium]|nr:glycosyl hydrolase-related protein [Prevotellaceae bacterium]